MRGGGRAAIGVGVALAVVALMAASVTGVEAASHEESKGGAYVFLLNGTHSHKMLVLAGSRRADGVGEITVLVDGKDGNAIYTAPATVTDTGIHADLGPLGSFSLDVVKTGRTVTRRPECGGRPVTFEVERLAGNIEFHGEDGYTEAEATEVPIYYRFFLDLLCSASSVGEESGPGLPGAHLRVKTHVGSTYAVLNARKNGPGKPSQIDVAVSEERGVLRIQRSFSTLAVPKSFVYERQLGKATLKPPAPFSGHAAFRRTAAPRSRWTGNLSVDLPGRSDVELIGRGAKTKLVHVRWSASSGRASARISAMGGDCGEQGAFVSLCENKAPWVTPPWPILPVGSTE
jgi:hypothetical protein